MEINTGHREDNETMPIFVGWYMLLYLKWIADSFLRYAPSHVPLSVWELSVYPGPHLSLNVSLG